MIEQIKQICACKLALAIRMGTPTRYESVGCDDGRFIFPKEYRALGEVYSACKISLDSVKSVD